MRTPWKAALIAGVWAASATGLATPCEAQDAARPARAPDLQPKSAATPWRFVAWPIVVDDPQGVFIYATRGATNVGLSPYQNNLAIGYETLNPATHSSPRCNSTAGFAGFCGDEVAYGDSTLQHDVTGRDNTAIGDHALANLTSGTSNTAVGSSAAANIHATVGVDAFGVAACQDGVDYAGPITCVGQASLEVAGPSSRYTAAFGYQAGLHAADAEFSTLLGVAAGFTATTDRNSILIGESACGAANRILDVICIGTINGPRSGTMSDVLWLGGNNGSTPILYGDLRTNALVIDGTAPAAGAGLTVNGGGVAAPFVRTVSTTVAGLSTADPSPQAGDRAAVTNATACVFGGAPSAGGSTFCPVIYNGSRWIEE
jgi:hypothetical protein